MVLYVTKLEALLRQMLQWNVTSSTVLKSGVTDILLIRNPKLPVSINHGSCTWALPLAPISHHSASLVYLTFPMILTFFYHSADWLESSGLNLSHFHLPFHNIGTDIRSPLWNRLPLCDRSPPAEGWRFSKTCNESRWSPLVQTSCLAVILADTPKELSEYPTIKSSNGARMWAKKY